MHTAKTEWSYRVTSVAAENARSLYSGKPSSLVGVVTGWYRYAFLIGLLKLEKYVLDKPRHPGMYGLEGNNQLEPEGEAQGS